MWIDAGDGLHERPPAPPADPSQPGSTGPGGPTTPARHGFAGRKTVVAAAVWVVSAGRCGALAGAGRGSPGCCLRITDEGGDLVARSRPSAPIVGRSPSAAGVVRGPATWRGRRRAQLPGQCARSAPLAELARRSLRRGSPHRLSPDGGLGIAVAVGDPQGPSFGLEIVDPRSGALDRVPRGLNGTPSWLVPGTVAVDVIEPDGTSAIATVEIAGAAA